jgi:hypothetical protein
VKGLTADEAWTLEYLAAGSEPGFQCTTDTPCADDGIPESIPPEIEAVVTVLRQRGLTIDWPCVVDPREPHVDVSPAGRTLLALHRSGELTRAG